MSKKNIVLILADQLRADFCGCYGADFLKTPNIDKLSQDGVLYCDAVTPSPACVPARASLLTGKSAFENRVLDNAKWLRPDHEKTGTYTWAQSLAQNGYSTAAIGKMHFYPWDIREGFQYRVIAEDKRHIEIDDDYSIFLKKRGYKRLHGKEHEGFYENQGAIVSKIPDELQIDKFVCDETLEYIDFVDKSRPFALFVGFPGPHCPYDPTQKMLDNLQDSEMPMPCERTKDSDLHLAKNISDNLCAWNGVDLNEFTLEKKLKVRKYYAALVQMIDDHVGAIVQKLKDENLYDDTIIIFTSDHGDYLGDFGMAGKGHFYKSATDIPLIVKNTGTTPQKVEHPVSLTDVYSTIMNFAGIKVSDTPDSTTLYPFGESKDRASILGCNEMGWMLREHQYQLAVYYDGAYEMYDLINDKNQQHNLINEPEFKEKAEEMRKELMARVFKGISAGNMDNQAKHNNLIRDKGHDDFNYEGWQRPYPFGGV